MVVSNGLMVTVQLKQTEVFQDLLALMNETVNDERVSEEVREELKIRIEELAEKLEKE